VLPPPPTPVISSTGGGCFKEIVEVISFFPAAGTLPSSAIVTVFSLI